MAISHKISLKIVNYKLFKWFIASLKSKFKIMSHGTLKADIMNLFQSMKKEILKEISKNKRLVLTINLWNSSNQSPLMVFLEHIITSNWNLK